MRTLAVFISAGTLAGCDMLIERNDLVGTCQVSSEANGSLTLSDDGTYLLSGEGVEDGVGEWTMERAYGDTRLVFYQTGGSGITYHDVRWNWFDDPVLVMSPSGLPYLKVD